MVVCLMSIILPSTIKAIAHSVDIPKLSDDAAKTLAPDVEYRLREVVQVPLCSYTVHRSYKTSYLCSNAAVDA